MKVPRPADFRRLRRSPLLSLRNWRRRVVFWVGAIVVSLIAIAFAGLANEADRLFHVVLAYSPYAPFALAPAGLALSVWLTVHVFPGAQGSGIPQVIASLEMDDPERINQVLSLRVAVGKVVLTLLGLACGASIGREGPTVQVSASIMQALGRIVSLPRAGQQRALVLAGGAAGIAAAFNTPLAGIVFADRRTQPLLRIAHQRRGANGGDHRWHRHHRRRRQLQLLRCHRRHFAIGIGWAAVLVCALLGGAAGGIFADTLIRAARATPGVVVRFGRTYPIFAAALCGLAIATLGLLSGGATYGTGYAQARALVGGESNLPVQFFALKFFATIVSYVSGIPGGIFAPSLAVGAGLGRAIAHLLPAAPTGAVVLLGMVAYFSGVVQAPITAAVIVMEMTDNQHMMIPLMANIASGNRRLATGLPPAALRHASCPLPRSPNRRRQHRHAAP